VEPHGIKVCESSNRGPVIPGKYAIDFTLDNTGKRHCLHSYERRHYDPRWAAIREKHAAASLEEEALALLSES
jgi:hypothetical protein